MSNYGEKWGFFYDIAVKNFQEVKFNESMELLLGFITAIFLYTRVFKQSRFLVGIPFKEVFSIGCDCQCVFIIVSIESLDYKTVKFWLNTVRSVSNWQ